MALLDEIAGPADLRALSRTQLVQLAAEIRRFLISNVSRTGGHLGPNLGVVELTIALHCVFDSPFDPIIFDTGHQSYVHKILTGRADRFTTLRQKDGLSGYPSRAESEHDWVENSHASTALSWAEGLAKAFRLRGQSDRTVVAVVGDGALTGGMAWEALNNIAVETELPLIIVVNDNGRSYAPTVGGLSHQLSEVRTDPRYEQTLEVLRRVVSGTPLVGRTAYELLHGLKIGLKDVLVGQSMFSDLGIKYTGPIDGHDITDLVRALQQAKGYGGPVIVHVITRKGAGFKAAEDNEVDRFHAVGRFNEFTGESLSASDQATWTDAFAQELVELGDSHPELVAITAAMLHPTGLARFAAAHPDRVFDVGIAEQHAVTAAAGMATGGLHPLVAVYSTFLNRAFDQLLLDVGLHHLGVTFVLDRAGVTGPDGPSHHGMWDVPLVGLVPGLMLAEPRDLPTLRSCLRAALAVDDRPTMIRFAKGRLPDELPAIARVGDVDVLAAGTRKDLLLVGYGSMASTAVQVAEQLHREGIEVTVVSPTWVLPTSEHLIELAGLHGLVVTLEDNLVVGGLGSRLRSDLVDRGIATTVRTIGIPQDFLPAGTRTQLLDELGMSPKKIVDTLTSWLVKGQDGPAEVAQFSPADQQSAAAAAAPVPPTPAARA